MDQIAAQIVNGDVTAEITRLTLRIAEMERVEGLAGIPTDRIAELECQKNACHQVISEREQRIAELEAEIKAKDAQFRLCAAHGGNAADPAPKYCPKCLESQVAELEASLKKVQNIAKGAMDKLPERWNMGFQAGLKQAIPHEKELTDALTAERQGRQDDNAALTEDILRLEAENARLKSLEDKMGSGWALVEYENARIQAARECVDEMEGYPTTVSVHATSHDAQVASATKWGLILAVKAKFGLEG